MAEAVAAAQMLVAPEETVVPATSELVPEEVACAAAVGWVVVALVAEAMAAVAMVAEQTAAHVGAGAGAAARPLAQMEAATDAEMTAPAHTEEEPVAAED